MMRYSRKQNSERGFTIVELMIATVVFSVVMLMCSMAIIQIGRIYYKGITTSRTQEAARAILDEISQAIQLNGGAVTQTTVGGANKIFCIGDQRYSYRLGVQVNDSSVKHALVIENSTCTPPSPDAIEAASYTPLPEAQTLVPSKMRLSNLVVKDLGNYLYVVVVRVVYGDDDLLDDKLKPDPSDSAKSIAGTDGVLDTCKNIRAGSQFCAVSELTTTVQKRLN